MPSAIIVGASSGIGRALAHELSRRGYVLGLTARREPLLQELAGELPNRAWVRAMDVAEPEAARAVFTELVAEMGGTDLVVINAGVGHLNSKLEWPPEAATIAVNVSGFAALATAAMGHFAERGHGHLAGISSIAALRGGGAAPAYGASKAFMSNYLEGLRQNAHKRGLDIAVTDVQPGFVDTPMAQGEGRFWEASAEQAAAQIAVALIDRRRHLYVTRRWRLIAWLLKLLPEPLYRRLA